MSRVVDQTILSLRGVVLSADDAKQIIRFVHSRTDAGPFLGYQIDFIQGTRRNVRASYYRRDGGWVAFKDDEHKLLLDIPEASIKAIERVDDTK